MRFRPANISLINRRLYLPRLLLTLPSIETDDQRILTGHYISMSESANTRPETGIAGKSLFDALPQKLKRRILSVNHSSFPVLAGDKE